MPSIIASIALAGTLAVPAPAPQEEPSPAADRIYGRVTTAAGDVFQGYIRWDRNEGSWADLLEGSKELPFRNLRQAEELTDRRRSRDEDSVEFLGITISWSDDEDPYPDLVQSAVRFGHLRTLEVLDDDRVLLELKSGREVELRSGSTDVGDGNRGIEVVDADRGTVELRWRDLDRVEFQAAPAGAPAPPARRLYGTLRTDRGQEYTGFVSWDVDEILGSDVLDGDDRGRDREIPFDRIAAIEYDGASGALVVLRNGEEVALDGSNDVNDSNRGIAVSDPALGQVVVEWEDFESLTFQAPPPSLGGYDAFDGGGALYGTVVTEGDRHWTGRVRWDNDEEFSWEILNGEQRDVEFSVEMGRIESIRKRRRDGVEVFLRDGRTLELEDSNDVNDRNKGIFVTTDDGETVAVEWDDFREVSFQESRTARR